VRGAASQAALRNEDALHLRLQDPRPGSWV